MGLSPARGRERSIVYHKYQGFGKEFIRIGRDKTFAGKNPVSSMYRAANALPVHLYEIGLTQFAKE
jgi:hypothetical protein